MNENMRQMLENQKTLYINQIKEWVEIFTDIETKNKYQILNENQTQIGYIAERSGGLLRFFSRNIFGSHRPLSITVWNSNRDIVLNCHRSFFFFFSSLYVESSSGEKIGCIKRRFGILSKKYDLLDENDQVFAKIKSPIWKIWTFKIYNFSDLEIGIISKNWGGILKEVFSDADKFHIQFPDFDFKKKSIILAAAISIDMDFFEENENR